MTQSELLAKINALAKKKREQGLSNEESELQQKLYKEYLTIFRSNVKRQLDNVDVEFSDGRVVPLNELKKKKE